MPTCNPTKTEVPMCSLENAIETMDKSVLVSHEVFKILVDEYRNAHTEYAVTALLDE